MLLSDLGERVNKAALNGGVCVYVMYPSFLLQELFVCFVPEAECVCLTGTKQSNFFLFFLFPSECILRDGSKLGARKRTQKGGNAGKKGNIFPSQWNASRRYVTDPNVLAFIRDIFSTDKQYGTKLLHSTVPFKGIPLIRH